MSELSKIQGPVKIIDAGVTLLDADNTGIFTFSHKSNTYDTIIDGNNITFNGAAAQGNFIYGSSGSSLRFPVGNGNQYFNFIPGSGTILASFNSTTSSYSGFSLIDNGIRPISGPLTRLITFNTGFSSQASPDHPVGITIGADYHYANWQDGPTTIYASGGRDAASVYNGQDIRLYPGKGNPNVGGSGDDGNVIIGEGTMTSKLGFLDDTVYVGRDPSGNLIFNDGITGPKTLAELASGGGGTIVSRIENTATTSYLEYGTSGADAFLTGKTTLTGDNEVLGLTNGSSVKVFEVNAQGSIFNAGARVFSFDITNNNLFISDERTNDTRLTSAYNNVVIGSGAGASISTAQRNILIGASAGLSVIGNQYGVAIGQNANLIGNDGVAIGGNAEASSGSVSIGRYAGSGGAGSYNLNIGYRSGDDTNYAGSYNVLTGYRTGYRLLGGSGNILSGRDTGFNLTTGNDNIFIGPYAGYYETTNSDRFILSTLTNTEQVDQSTALTKALLYGLNSSITANQLLRVNGEFQVLTGNVGIGTVSPYDLFHIQSTDAITSMTIDNLVSTIGNVAALRFKVSAGNEDLYKKAGIFFERTGGNGVGKIHFVNDSSTDTGNATIADSKMTIDYLGNVGIGTTSPVYKLQVEGGDIMFRYGTNENRFLFTGLTSPTADAKLTMYDNTSTAKILLNSAGDSYLIGGNVGIGTSSPSYALDVDGEIRAQTNYRSADGTAGYTGTLDFQDNLGIDITITYKNGLVTDVSA